MASAPKRMRVHNYYYQGIWEDEYFVAPIGDRCRCLMCAYVFGTNRKYVVQRHFDTYHANLNVDFPKGSQARKREIERLKLELPQTSPVYSADVGTTADVNSTTRFSERMAETSVRYQRQDRRQSLRQIEDAIHIGSRISVSTRVWTQPEIEILLREYRKHEFLYNVDHVNYRNKFARQKAFENVAKHICKIRPETTGVDVKVKFKKLRYQYYGELSKGRKYAEEGKPYVSTLWFIDHIKFLSGGYRQTINNQRETEGLNFENSQLPLQVRYEDQASLSEDYSIDIDEKYDYENMDGENSEDPLSNTKKRTMSFVIKTEKLDEDTEGDFGSEATSDDKDEDEEDRSNSPTISPATSTLLNQTKRGEQVQVSESHSRKMEEPNTDIVGDTSTQNSEEDLFGQLVAKKLKMITNPRKRANTEFEIFTILHAALVEELG